ncbi:PREDICTED: dnaJ homolog subfamily C member 5B isoform X3 [Populus euphratica]|uniref:DnaJ homolog subfamily C member 5B isoform X3 n=1 Tax=Populus euphratica TaxID=75702 RepID=A0AAJ6VBE7_POPEU|nr:PREDICTED: dnaJ homolog subfamily C member 5B isoform X3 [Populus euphratica]
MEDNENTAQKINISSSTSRSCSTVGTFHLVWQDYYKILEVDYDATDEKIRLNYRMLALKWHPDKHLGDSVVTAKFQDISEAYKVLSDPAKRFEYDLTGIYEIDKYTVREYLARFKGMILTCNGLGISNTSTWTQQLTETKDLAEK